MQRNYNSAEAHATDRETETINTNGRETVSSKSEARRIDPTAEKIFRKLIEGGPKIIGEKDGGFMPVHVERVGNGRWSIAHYFTQNGDRCCDPDMTFQVHADHVEVVEFEQAIPPVYQHADRLDSRQVLEMAHFANQWMRNIREQQGLEV